MVTRTESLIRYLWDRMLKWGWDYNRDLRDDGLVESHRPARMRSRGGANSIAICDVADDNIDLTDFEWLALDQNACRFHGRIAYDRDYAGMALDASEGQRVAGLLGAGKSVLFMGNHGVIVVGPTVAQALDELYYLEKAAKLQVLALSTGRPLALIPEPLAALACAQWNDYPTAFSALHFAALKDILDHEEPEYKA